MEQRHQDGVDIQEVLANAIAAIARAKRLSESYRAEAAALPMAKFDQHSSDMPAAGARAAEAGNLAAAEPPVDLAARSAPGGLSGSSAAGVWGSDQLCAPSTSQPALYNSQELQVQSAVALNPTSQLAQQLLQRGGPSSLASIPGSAPAESLSISHQPRQPAGGMADMSTPLCVSGSAPTSCPNHSPSTSYDSAIPCQFESSWPLPYPASSSCPMLPTQLSTSGLDTDMSRGRGNHSCLPPSPSGRLAFQAQDLATAPGFCSNPSTPLLASGALAESSGPPPTAPHSSSLSLVRDAHAQAADSVCVADPQASPYSPLPLAFDGLMARAARLVALQRQQADTLAHLLHLRHEQLRLRRQQLSALQCLLRSEEELSVCSPSQTAAVSQAVLLLGDSLADVALALDLLVAMRAADMSALKVCEVSDSVAQTDQRAEEVSGMARQLLLLLRNAPQRLEMLMGPVALTAHQLPSYSNPTGAASDADIAALPVMVCEKGSVLLDDTCSICLAAFEPGDQLRCLQCTHYHHCACLDEWLRIRASCPLCKLNLATEAAPWL